MHSTLQPFHVPIFLSVHIPLGGPFKPVRLGGACNAAGSFILTTLTRPHAHRHRRQPHFCGSFVLTRTFRASSVRSTAHPHHGHFIDPRRIICTPHRWGTFHSTLTRLFGQTSADFSGLCTVQFLQILPHTAVSRQAFQGVAPSFHLLEYQFFKSIFKLLSILQNFDLSVTFSVRNVSHWRRTRPARSGRAGAGLRGGSGRRCSRGSETPGSKAGTPES